ncbi:M67 family metallopeptidase [Arthrobacter sp. TMN-49]
MTRTLTITDAAWRILRAAGTQELPREIGGLLLGYYTELGPHVTEARVVPDPRATRIRYRRDSAVAERILDSGIRADGSGLLGYLGEWHTHPLPIGPSTTDINASGRLAKAGGHDIALLILAMGTRGWIGHALNVDPAGDMATLNVHVEGISNDG